MHGQIHHTTDGKDAEYMLVSHSNDAILLLGIEHARTIYETVRLFCLILIDREKISQPTNRNRAKQSEWVKLISLYCCQFHQYFIFFIFTLVAMRVNKCVFS